MLFVLHCSFSYLPALKMFGFLTPVAPSASAGRGTEEQEGRREGVIFDVSERL